MTAARPRGEHPTVGRNSEGAVDNGGAPSEPVDGNLKKTRAGSAAARSKAAARNGGAKSGSNGKAAKNGSNGKSGNGGSNGSSAEAKATAVFEAPHRRQEETLISRIAGSVALHFWRTCSWLMGHVPPGPAYRIGSGLSMIGYAFGPKRRRWLRSNFGHVLGVSPSDRRAGAKARAAYRNYARYVMEVMRLPWVDREEAEGMLDLEGLDKFLDIYHKSNGVVLVSGHFGNNEAAAAGFVSHGLPISVVGDDTAYAGLYELLRRQREMWGAKIIPWRNLRGVYGVLRRRECLALLVDWGYRADGIPVKFFDAWTTLPAGPAQLAARHGSPIFPFAVHRLPNGRFRGSGGDPIFVASTEPADLQRATQAVAHALERFILEAPEHWYIFKPIWPQTEAEMAELEKRYEAIMAGECVDESGLSIAQSRGTGSIEAGVTTAADSGSALDKDEGIEGLPAGG